MASFTVCDVCDAMPRDESGKSPMVPAVARVSTKFLSESELKTAKQTDVCERHIGGEATDQYRFNHKKEGFARVEVNLVA